MELYHVLNRGVDKRSIFMEDGDRVRFVNGLYTFNDDLPANNTRFLLARSHAGLVEHYDRNCLVDIHGWCIMGNHYHLLLSERDEGGLTKFITKLNVGYAKYFNKKYERTGTLFESRTKKVLINNDAHFLHILHYIHLNPLDFLKGAEDWRELEIRNVASALKHLDNYRWSSFADYCGKKNFPSVISPDLFKDFFGDYRAAISSYLKDMETETLRDLMLE